MPATPTQYGPCQHQDVVYLRVDGPMGQGFWTCTSCAAHVPPERGDKPRFRKKEVARLKFIRWLHTSGQCKDGCGLAA